MLARTSNPEGGDVQLSRTAGGVTVSQSIVDAAAAENTRSGQNAIGLVVGGTHADPGCDVSAFNGSILVPGIGAQGGTVAGLADIFGDAVRLILPSASRQVMLGGPSAEGLRAAFSEINH